MNNESLPKKFYAKMRKAGEKPVFSFSTTPPTHGYSEPFFQYGEYVLKNLFISGSGFKISFKDEKDEEGALYGPKERKPVWKDIKGHKITSDR